MALHDEYDEMNRDPTLEQFKERMTTLFQASTNKDDLWQQWQKIYQTKKGLTARITTIATELELIRSRLPLGSVSAFAQKQRFLEAMDNRLRRSVEPQLKGNETWIEMVEMAERYDATMFRTGAYGNRTEASDRKPRSQPANKATTKTATTSKSKDKHTTKTTKKKSNKPGKAEMERRKKEGACYYCGKSGHMANECPEKDGRSNRVTETSDSEQEEESSEEEEEESDLEDLDDELFVGYVGMATLAKTTITQDKAGPPLQALEATIRIDGHDARVLFDTGTIGFNLISNRFITTHNMPYEPLSKPVTLKMAVKGSRSSANNKCKAKVEIGRHSFSPTHMTISSLDTYDALIGYNFLRKHEAIIDCKKNSIYFPSQKLRIFCIPKSTKPRSAMAAPANAPNFITRHPQVFVNEVPQKLPPLRKINHRIRLKDPALSLNMPQYKIGHQLLPKLKEWIDKEVESGSLYRAEAPGAASMFVQPKSDGRIRPLVDLRKRNDNTIKDHSPIPNQQVILNSVGRAKYRSKIDLSDAYFQTRVHPDDEKYNTIKTPYGAFACRIMLQGDTNAPATFMRVMEDTLSEFLGDFVWVYLDDILIFSETPEDHIRHVDAVCKKLKEVQLYASPKKSVFFAEKLEILGHIIDDNGIHPCQKRSTKFRTGPHQRTKRNWSDLMGL